jgi:hypothetical protein
MIRHPDESILPILEVRQDGTPEAFLGTAFVLAPRGLIVTACHVIAGRPSNAGNRLVVAIEAHDDVYRELRQIQNVCLSPTKDVAVAELQSLTGLRPLTLLAGEAPTNVDVLAVDHSSTQIRVDDGGRRSLRFSPGTLKGNIVRHYVSDFGTTRGMRCFDTSFPALGGASGAPVLVPPRFGVAGMLVANVQRHLLPAQILTVNQGDTTIEEVRYHLPFGQGLEADEIALALSSLGITLQ